MLKKSDMRRIIVVIAGCLFCAGTLGAKNVKVNYVVTNVDHHARVDEPVVIALGTGWFRSATVFDDKTEIPCQIDVLDSAGRVAELVFVLDLQPREQKQLQVVFSDRAAKPDRYASRVHAQMFVKEGKTNVPVREVSATADNMYNKLHHHGPAFESDRIAYRIYFDRKQTIDVYGKLEPGLELAETLWYPTDEQLSGGSGDDIIRVFGSVGVGALKGWDDIRGEAVHIHPVERRQARIMADGPVRTVVDMEVWGWDYRGRKIGMNSRYILYAGHRDVSVENRLSGDLRNLVLTTGVMKMAEHERYVDGRGVAAVWGTDYPVNDTVKYAKETCGLAVAIAPEYVKEQRDDDLNYLYLVVPDAHGRVDYKMTVAAEKEHFGYKSSEQFFDYVRGWAEDARKPSRVAPGRIRSGFNPDGSRFEEFLSENVPKELLP